MNNLITKTQLNILVMAAFIFMTSTVLLHYKSYLLEERQTFAAERVVFLEMERNDELKDIKGSIQTFTSNYLMGTDYIIPEVTPTF